MSTAVLEFLVGESATHRVQRAVVPAPAGKRAFDVCSALFAILLLAPVMVVVALAVKFSDRGPVLFRQERLGRGGRTFKITKFRTMAVDAEVRLHADPELHARYVANCFKLCPSEDPRIGRLGRFLRASSLDELPQLFNVVMGEMSMVGPRPIVAHEIDEYVARGAGTSYLGATPGIT